MSNELCYATRTHRPRYVVESRVAGPGRGLVVVVDYALPYHRTPDRLGRVAWSSAAYGRADDEGRRLAAGTAAARQRAEQWAASRPAEYGLDDDVPGLDITERLARQMAARSARAVLRPGH